MMNIMTSSSSSSSSRSRPVGLSSLLVPTTTTTPTKRLRSSRNEDQQEEVNETIDESYYQDEDMMEEDDDDDVEELCHHPTKRRCFGEGDDAVAAIAASQSKVPRNHRAVTPSPSPSPTPVLSRHVRFATKTLTYRYPPYHEPREEDEEDSDNEDSEDDSSSDDSEDDDDDDDSSTVAASSSLSSSSQRQQQRRRQLQRRGELWWTRHERRLIRERNQTLVDTFHLEHSDKVQHYLHVFDMCQAPPTLESSNFLEQAIVRIPTYARGLEWGIVPPMKQNRRIHCQHVLHTQRQLLKSLPTTTATTTATATTVQLEQQSPAAGTTTTTGRRLVEEFCPNVLATRAMQSSRPSRVMARLIAEGDAISVEATNKAHQRQQQKRK